MKKTFCLAAALVTLALPALAAMYTFDYASGFANGGVIPDGNPSGWSDTRAVSIPQTGITDVNVRLTLSGGYNGDLYGYLVFNGGFAVLLNRVGTGSGSEPQFSYGFSTAGLNNVRLDDSASPNIHTVANPAANGTYASDGGTLASFNGLDPNGSWTLFFADLSAGDQTTLTSWSLEITAVPEPVPAALGLFGGLLALGGLVRTLQTRRALAKAALV